MKIRLDTDTGRHDATPPYSGAPCVEVSGWACACGSARVHCERSERGHVTVEGNALCFACGAAAGRLVVTFETIFGLEEDERVLNGRPRVY